MSLTKVTYWMIDQQDGPFTNPLYLGATGDGVADDTSYVQAAIDAGTNVFIPEGYTFAVSGLTGFIDGQQIYGGGCLKKYGLVQEPICLLPDEIENVWFNGIEFDGNSSAFSNGNPVPAILGYITHSIKVTNCNFHDIIDVGVKLRDGANLYATGNRFYNIGENGIELHNYTVDVRTGNQYTGTRPIIEGNHQIIGNHFEKITRYENPLGPLVDACAIAFFGATGYPQQNIVIADNVIIDCLRYIWTENNNTGSVANGVVITGNTMQGGVNGGTAQNIYGKAGVGIIAAQNVVVANNTFRNIANHNPVGTETACIIVSGSAGVAVGENIEITGNSCVDDSGLADRTEWGIYCLIGNDIKIHNNTVSGTLNAGGIYIDPTNCTRVNCYANTFTESEYSWNQIVPVVFTLLDIDASESLTAAPYGFTALTSSIIPSAGRIAGISAQLSSAPTAGAISIKTKINGTEETPATISIADFGATVKAIKKFDAANTTQMVAGDLISVTVDTDSSYLPINNNLVVTLFVDIGYKQ